jgi:tRNA(adenine34) deaminase
MFEHEYWMRFALKEAEKAFRENEVPVGAVIVFDNKIIGRGYNRIEALQDPTAHAEIQAITAASEYLGSRRLLDTTLYVTLEPCVMCSGAISQARIPRVVFAARDPKGGACASLYNILSDTRLNHRAEIIEGILADEASMLLSGFFRKLRKNKKS